MKIGIYNQFWSSLGGGEQYAGGIAQALATKYHVDVLVHGPIDLAESVQRLGLDLSATHRREIPAVGWEVSQVSRDYDLFINCSYASHQVSRAERSLYVTYFPMDLRNHSIRKRALNLGAKVYGSLGISIELGRGFYSSERRFAWTDGDAELFVRVPEGREVSIELHLRAAGWPQGRAPRASVTVDGSEAWTGVVRSSSPTNARAALGRGRGNENPFIVRIQSDAFVPAEALNSDDHRSLGVMLTGCRLGSPSVPLPYRLGNRLLRPEASLAFLDTYSAIVTISEFAREWTRRYWNRDSLLLFPPVSMHEEGPKEQVILSVGRFFDRRFGHSKKQLEMVEAMRSACQRGLRGWTLHLVGGCSSEHRPYLDQVRRAAEGLPVRFHVNAVAADLEDLFARASIYWHAAGFGEKLQRHPGRFEHFGISVVEAMSAGAVPIVLDKGGPAASVRNGIDGYHFATLAELAARTVHLAENPELMKTMSTTAKARAREFTLERFQGQLDVVLETVMNVPVATAGR